MAKALGTQVSAMRAAALDPGHAKARRGESLSSQLMPMVPVSVHKAPKRTAFGGELVHGHANDLRRGSRQANARAIHQYARALDIP